LRECEGWSESESERGQLKEVGKERMGLSGVLVVRIRHRDGAYHGTGCEHCKPERRATVRKSGALNELELGNETDLEERWKGSPCVSQSHFRAVPHCETQACLFLCHPAKLGRICGK
jgi:hypothetical protein